jgi:7-carboxy-7-deazaguanine synthase
MWDLQQVVAGLRTRYKVAVETQGSLFREWVAYCNLITLSPKGPSSGMQGEWVTHVLNEYMSLCAHDRFTKIVLKVVVFNEEDYVFARDVHAYYPKVDFYLSVGTPTPTPKGVSLKLHILLRMQQLFERTLKDEDMQDVTILPQLHTLAWGEEKGR